MIKINNSQFYAYWSGMFATDNEWIHPERVEKTYEFIYVLNGTVYMREDDKDYVLTPKNLLLLDADKKHCGFKTSTGITSFFYAHFHIDDISVLPPLNKYIENFNEGYLFKEHIHTYCTPNRVDEIADISMLNLLSKVMVHNTASTKNSKLATDIYEWIKINASMRLSADMISERFGYSTKHISRVLKTQYGQPLVKIIANFIVQEANNLLGNTNNSIKEIADSLGFSDYNLFTKFYIYHTGIAPTNYRSSHTKTTINKK